MNGPFQNTQKNRAILFQIYAQQVKFVEERFTCMVITIRANRKLKKELKDSRENRRVLLMRALDGRLKHTVG
jgi:hypothetical protein